MTVNQVKDELRRIRFGQRAIEAIEFELAAKRKRMLCLPSNSRSALRLQKRISDLEREIGDKIAEQDVLESKYDPVIAFLDEIDQIIVRECYISGRSYADLGKRLGYSVRGIEYRMKGIIERLADML